MCLLWAPSSSSCTCRGPRPPASLPPQEDPGPRGGFSAPCSRLALPFPSPEASWGWRPLGACAELWGTDEGLTFATGVRGGGLSPKEPVQGGQCRPRRRGQLLDKVALCSLLCTKTGCCMKPPSPCSQDHGQSVVSSQAGKRGPPGILTWWVKGHTFYVSKS